MPENWYISLYRLLLESEIMTKPPEWFKLWIVILLKCNFEDRGIYKRGEFVTKYETLASEASVSYNTVDKFLRWACSRDMVGTEKLTRGVRLRVINYDDYQIKSGTEAGQKRDRSGTINKRIIKELNKEGKREEKIEDASPPLIDSEKKPETPAKTPPTAKPILDHYEKELDRIEDTEVREAVATWWEYKRGYKNYKTPAGWKSFISIVLGYEKSIILEAITRAMAGSWQGIRPQDVKKERERGSGPVRSTRSDYFWLLEEWPEAIQVIARNELNDLAFATKRQVDENTARGKIYAVVVRYYRQPGKATEDESAAILAIIKEWRERNQKTEVEDTPSNVIVNAIKKIILKK